MKKSVIKKIKDLKKQIYHHDHLYYNLDQPEITDQEYDKLFKQLLDLENQYPKLKTKDSPSQKIPGKALEKFKKEAHSLTMLSLQNSYSKEEIQAFYNRTLKLLKKDDSHKEDSKTHKRRNSPQSLKKENLSFFVEPKLDGMAVELLYEKGLLKKSLTRGDGKFGENITENIKTLRALPLNLKTNTKNLEFLEIRAEILIFKKDFKKINLEKEQKGLPIFANPRNLAAGSLRQLDPKVTACRPLYCFIHSPGLMKNNTIKTQEKFIEKIQNLGLPAFRICKSKKLKPPLELCRLVHSIEEISDYYDQMLQLRHELPFEIDGIVIKVNNFEQQKELGSIARSPRWAIAGKFPAEQGQTQVKDIRLQVGRTGVVTPVAILKAVSLGGVIIRQASLHNFQDLSRKDIRIGDVVLIHRAGDVIPELIRPLKEKRKKGLKAFLKPKNCPVCKKKLQKQGDYLICQNRYCPAIQENKFIHFASKKAMDIEFLGEKSIKKFYEWKWIKNYSDLYDLKDKALINKEGFGEKSYELLVKNLDKSKKTELPRLLFALGIPLIGEQTAQRISEKVYELFESEKNYELFKQKEEAELDLQTALLLLQKLSKEELENIPDVGPLVAQSFKLAFGKKNLISDLQRLHQKGIHFITKKKNQAKMTLKGRQFVITGKLPEPRRELKKRIEERGGRLFLQLSKKTNFLIEGENPGSKKKKAEKLGVKILNWEDFLSLLR